MGIIILFGTYEIFAEATPDAASVKKSLDSPTAEETSANEALFPETPVLGVDSTSPIADTQASIPEPSTDETSSATQDPLPVHGVDFEFLYNCANSPNMNQQKCDTARYFFCTGRCTRLNCAILTNRKICIEICGTAHPMMEGCIAAGKRNPAVAALADSMTPMMPYPPQGMNPMTGAGMNPGMAGAAMMGGVAASAVGSLFGKKR